MCIIHHHHWTWDRKYCTPRSFSVCAEATSPYDTYPVKSIGHLRVSYSFPVSGSVQSGFSEGHTGMIPHPIALQWLNLGSATQLSISVRFTNPASITYPYLWWRSRSSAMNYCSSVKLSWRFAAACAQTGYTQTFHIMTCHSTNFRQASQSQMRSVAQDRTVRPWSSILSKSTITFISISNLGNIFCYCHEVVSWLRLANYSRNSRQSCPCWSIIYFFVKVHQPHRRHCHDKVIDEHRLNIWSWTRSIAFVYCTGSSQVHHPILLTNNGIPRYCTIPVSSNKRDPHSFNSFASLHLPMKEHNHVPM